MWIVDYDGEGKGEVRNWPIVPYSIQIQMSKGSRDYTNTK